MKLPFPITVQSVADSFQAKTAGNPLQEITGINEIHMVEPGDITFVDHPKYYDKVLKSAATTIILNKEVECPEGKSLIFHDDPFTVYTGIIKKFRSFEPATAMVSPSAIIGEGTVIQPGAFVGNHVVIGKNCVIHPGVSIYDHCVIGNNVIIHSCSVIGADAFYFKKRDWGWDKMLSCGRVVLEDFVEVGANCTIDRGVSGDTLIGQGTKFDNHVQIGHDTVVGKHCLIGCATIIAGVTKIEDEVLIWARVAIQKDLVIGKGATILATSAVDKNLPGGKVYFGAPAEEARKKWREMAAVRQLPDLLQRLNKG
jgi:UDP-3-O-[3-hydroxymyristoyl] glucosamine N-acyltransferase